MNASTGQGFSLIEVIVSVLFLMITIAGLMTTYNYMSLQMERARWKQSALHIAQQTLEQFMADPGYQPGKAAQVPVTSSNSITSRMDINRDPNDQSIIECKISWPDKPDLFVSLKTIIK